MPDEQKSELNILQRDITYIEEFPDYGSYVSCLLDAVEIHLERKLRPYEVHQLYNKCFENKSISHDETPIKEGKSWYRCFVNSFIEAFNTGMKIFGGTYEAVEANDENPANIQIYERSKYLTDNNNKSSFTYVTPQGKKEINPDPDTRLNEDSVEKSGAYIRKVRKTTTPTSTLSFEDAFNHKKLSWPTDFEVATSYWYDRGAKNPNPASKTRADHNKFFEKFDKGFHKGLDIRARAGYPIYPCHPGTVCFVGNNKEQYPGLVIVISHGEGWYSFYAHLKKYRETDTEEDKKKRTYVGQKVEISNIIGQSGQGGKVDHDLEPHLHLEIRQRDGESGRPDEKNSGWMVNMPTENSKNLKTGADSLLYHNPLSGFNQTIVETHGLDNRMAIKKHFGPDQTESPHPYSQNPKGMNIIFSNGEIFSPVDGTIVWRQKDYNHEDGAYVKVKTDNHFHYFCHLNTWDDKLPEKYGPVRKGQLIGNMGGSSLNDRLHFGAHLHYRIELLDSHGAGSGKYIDPESAEGVDLRLLFGNQMKIEKHFGQKDKDPQYLYSNDSNGMDIVFSKGVIFSPVDGTVEYSEDGYNHEYGAYVKIEADGYYHYFCHLDTWSDELRSEDGLKSKTVKKGQYIGRMGGSSNRLRFRFTAHLHYRIKPVSPDTNNGHDGFINPTGVVDLNLLKGNSN